MFQFETNEFKAGEEKVVDTKGERRPPHFSLERRPQVSPKKVGFPLPKVCF